MEKNLELFLTSHFDLLFIFEIIVIKIIMFLERKTGVTECPRWLNPDKAVAMAICPIILHFIS